MDASRVAIEELGWRVMRNGWRWLALLLRFLPASFS